VKHAPKQKQFNFPRLISLMAISFQDGLLLVGLGLTLAIPIGPVNMEMIRQGIAHKRNGFLYSLFTGIGAITADFSISMTVLFFGSQYLNELLDIKFLKFSLFGLNTVILLLLGISAFRLNIEQIEMSLHDPSSLEGISSMRFQYFKGLVLVVTSPWSYLWWASFGPIILDRGIPLSSLNERLLVTLLFILGVFSWVVVISVVLQISNKFTTPRIQSNITKTSAFILIIFAVSIFFEALCVLIDFGYCDQSQGFKFLLSLSIALAGLAIFKKK
jgi:threonine/homoserine/homoserine lactone efflux protein